MGLLAFLAAGLLAFLGAAACAGGAECGADSCCVSVPPPHDAMPEEALSKDGPQDIKGLCPISCWPQLS